MHTRRNINGLLKGVSDFPSQGLYIYTYIARMHIPASFEVYYYHVLLLRVAGLCPRKKRSHTTCTLSKRDTQESLRFCKVCVGWERKKKDRFPHSCTFSSKMHRTFFNNIYHTTLTASRKREIILRI